MNVILTVLLTLLMFGIIILPMSLDTCFAQKMPYLCGGVFRRHGAEAICFSQRRDQYTLRLFPIGGYCKMPGKMAKVNIPTALTKSVPQRMLVVAGGALFNFIFAILLFIVAYMALGTPVNEARIGEVTEGMPAAEAGMLAGDEITAINGESVDTWAEAVTIINANEGNELTFTVDRDGESLSFQIVPELSEDGTQSVIGIVRDSERLSLFGAIQLGFQQTYDLTKLILVSLFDMVTGQADVELAGPVGIGQMVGQVANYGLLNFIIFIAAISVNLGVVNLLPLPALDGSRLVFWPLKG